MAKKIKVIITGAAGKMGTAAVKTFMEHSEHFELLGLCIRNVNESWAKSVEQEVYRLSLPSIKIYTDLEALIKTSEPDVLVELSNAESVFANTKLALEHSVSPVVGATGLTEDNLDELTELAANKKIGALIAPNFAIGAILMMKFAQEAARHFDKYEIIEMHHDKKLDAPSGTAIKTAQLIAGIKASRGLEDRTETALGDSSHGVPIHSLRLPGLVAHQEVIFGGLGQTLTIRHDSLDRSSFMPGILLSCEKVVELDHLVYGMENII